MSGFRHLEFLLHLALLDRKKVIYFLNVEICSTLKLLNHIRKTIYPLSLTTVNILLNEGFNVHIKVQKAMLEDFQLSFCLF